MAELYIAPTKSHSIRNTLLEPLKRRFSASGLRSDLRGLARLDYPGQPGQREAQKYQHNEDDNPGLIQPQKNSLP
jgi:hypothetical protein